MVQTSFLASSTNTGASPPLMHFFTQAEPLPACLAPHIASEIQPLMVESAARAESGAKARTAVKTAATRFTTNLQGLALFSIRYHHPLPEAIRQVQSGAGFSSDRKFTRWQLREWA